MKMYPSIPKDIRKDLYIYAFDKKDGSNIRVEWNSKRGFYKFGTRTQLIDEKTKPFNKAISLIKDEFEESLTQIFNSNKWSNVVCFFELFGPSSFAGSHNFDEDMKVVLIDVNVHKIGLLNPSEFIKYFGHLNIPDILYEGYINEELFDQIKDGTLPGMTYEGVVFKSDGEKSGPIMFKLKSRKWLQKLQEYCKDDAKLFNSLS